MASVRQKASGHWEARYRDARGQMHARTFPTKSPRHRGVRLHRPRGRSATARSSPQALHPPGSSEGGATREPASARPSPYLRLDPDRAWRPSQGHPGAPRAFLDHGDDGRVRPPLPVPQRGLDRAARRGVPGRSAPGHREASRDGRAHPMTTRKARRPRPCHHGDHGPAPHHHRHR